MTTNTGGPAFPVVGHFYSDKLGGQLDHGMTLRDYFAAKAMPMHGTALSNWGANTEHEWHANVARLAYLTADAMLKAREASK